MFGKPLEYDSYEVDFNIEVDNPSDEFEDILLNSQKVWDEDDFKHLPTTGRSDEAYVNEEKDVEVQKKEISSIEDEENRQRQIEVPLTTILSTLKIKKGRKKQTNNLTKFLKDLVYRLLKNLKTVHYFSKQEEEEIESFKNSNCSLKGFETLFMNQKISEICLEYLSSSTFMKQILQSKKLIFERKLQVLKYVDQLRNYSIGKANGWKNVEEIP